MNNPHSALYSALFAGGPRGQQPAIPPMEAPEPAQFSAPRKRIQPFRASGPDLVGLMAAYNRLNPSPSLQQSTALAGATAATPGIAGVGGWANRRPPGF